MSDEQTEILDSLKAAIEKAYLAGKADAASNGATVSPEDLALLFHCALGYAVGRRTYITHSVPAMLRSYWPWLSHDARITLERNLRSDVEYRMPNDLGDACDIKNWFSLLEWMSAQLVTEQRS